MMNGVIFDFNGTLYDDTDFQEAAWAVMFEKYKHRKIGPTEFQDHFHGLTNADISSYFLGSDPDPKVWKKIYDDKEETYRRLCRENRSRVHFVKGVIPMFDDLTRLKIPFAIATASEITNVDFYFEMFDLAKWFPHDRVIYDNGTFPGKPAPDIYLRAADQLGQNPADCIVCEDSLNGVRAAENAKIGRIIVHRPILNTTQLISRPSIYAVIDDFVDFTTKYLN